MTKRVCPGPDHTGMDFTRPNALEACNAVMIGLGPRWFVIIRRDDEPRLQRVVSTPARIRDLVPGDEVFYKGRRHVVRSVQPYE